MPEEEIISGRIMKDISNLAVQVPNARTIRKNKGDLPKRMFSGANSCDLQKNVFSSCEKTIGTAEQPGKRLSKAKMRSSSVYSQKFIQDFSDPFDQIVSENPAICEKAARLSKKNIPARKTSKKSKKPAKELFNSISKGLSGIPGSKVSTPSSLSEIDSPSSASSIFRHSSRGFSSESNNITPEHALDASSRLYDPQRYYCSHDPQRYYCSGDPHRNYCSSDSNEYYYQDQTNDYDSILQNNTLNYMQQDINTQASCAQKQHFIQHRTQSAYPGSLNTAVIDNRECHCLLNPASVLLDQSTTNLSIDSFVANPHCSFIIFTAILLKFIDHKNSCFTSCFRNSFDTSCLKNCFKSCYESFSCFSSKTQVLAYIFFEKFALKNKFDDLQFLVDMYVTSCIVAFKTQIDGHISNDRMRTPHLSLSNINYLEALLLNSLSYNINANVSEIEQAIIEIQANYQSNYLEEIYNY